MASNPSRARCAAMYTRWCQRRSNEGRSVKGRSDKKRQPRWGGTTAGRRGRPRSSQPMWGQSATGPYRQNPPLAPVGGIPFPARDTPVRNHGVRSTPLRNKSRAVDRGIAATPSSVPWRPAGSGGIVNGPFAFLRPGVGSAFGSGAGAAAALAPLPTRLCLRGSAKCRVWTLFAPTVRGHFGVGDQGESESGPVSPFDPARRTPASVAGTDGGARREPAPQPLPRPAPPRRARRGHCHRRRTPTRRPGQRPRSPPSS